jgi:hypothetical protein
MYSSKPQASLFFKRFSSNKSILESFSDPRVAYKVCFDEEIRSNLEEQKYVRFASCQVGVYALRTEVAC